MEVNVPNAYATSFGGRGWTGVVAFTADNGAFSGDVTVRSGGVLVSNLTALGTGRIKMHPHTALIVAVSYKDAGLSLKENIIDRIDVQNPDGLAEPGLWVSFQVQGDGIRNDVDFSAQLYSLRGVVQDVHGFYAMLRLMKDFGYSGVEFAGVWGAPKEVKARLADLGLACAGAHCGLGQCRAETIAQTCDYNLAYGNDRLVMPWAQPSKGCPDEKGWWKKLWADLSAGAEVARRHGCTLAYHNHGHEFTRKVDGVRVWDLIMADASEDLKIQFDVGHLVHAGEKAADWFGRYPRRVVSIHAKDVCVPNAPLRPAPGRTGIDWSEMFALTQANAVGWYIVEAEAEPADTMKMKYGADFFRRAAPFIG